MGYFADGPDVGFWLPLPRAGRTPERLGFLLAHWPGYRRAHTLAARKFATLDQITGGRAAMHVITGGDDACRSVCATATRLLSKDERYDRTDEYVGILKRIWTEPGPTVDHEGRFYRFKGASTAIPLRCSPTSHSDLFRWRIGCGASRIRQTRRRLRCCGAKRTRRSGNHRSPAYRGRACRAEQLPVSALSFHVPSWPHRGRGVGARRTHRSNRSSRRGQKPDWRSGNHRMRARAACHPPPHAMGERLDKRLWTGAALATGARGANTTKPRWDPATGGRGVVRLL